MRIPHKLAPTAALPPTYAVLERKKAPPQNKIVLRRGLVCPGGENTPKGRLRRAEDRKKVLSLVLCVAMMLSVMVMGAGAAFTDQDKIVNEEAVDMISALGIVDGYEDDSFQPEKNIERGEAAKMIAVMLNGGKDAIQDATGSSFNDVLGSADAWANKYIEYCASEKIVAGVGGDRFAPASNVTGTQLAKMLLVSLGYDPIKEGYQNDNTWAVDVNTDAVKAGLFEGIENVDMSAALTRDNAAQMIWNALQADTVWYTSAGEIMKGQSLLAQAYDAYVVTGTMTDVYHYNKDAGKYTYTIAGDKYTSTTDYSDMFAMNVTAVVNYSKKALNVYADYSDIIATGNVGDISQFNKTTDKFDAIGSTITIDGQKYGVDNLKGDSLNIVAYNNYSNTNYAYCLEQYAFRAIDTDNGGDIDTIVVYPYAVLNVDDVDNDEFTVSTIVASDAKLIVDKGNQSGGMYPKNDKATVTFDDVIVNGTLARYGYVKYVPAQYTAENMDTYTALDIKSGVVNSANTKDYMLTIDGTQYNGTLLDSLEKFADISTGKTYSYVEVNGYLFIVDGAGIVDENYALVTDISADTTGTTDKVWNTTVLLPNGDSKTVLTKAQMTVGSLYTYTVDANDYWTLTAVKDGSLDANTSIYDVQEAYAEGANLSAATKSSWSLWNYYTDGTARYNDDASGDYFMAKNENQPEKYYVSDDAAIYVYYAADGKYDVISGADLANSDLAGKGEVCWAFTGANEASNGYNYVELGYIVINHDVDEVNVNAYVNDVVERTYTEDGVKYYYADVEVMLPGGEMVTMTTEKFQSETAALIQAVYSLEEGKIYEVTLLNDEIVHVNTNALTLREATVTATDDVRGDKLGLDFGSGSTLNGTYFITEDTDIYDLDTVGVTEITVGDTVYVIIGAGNKLTALMFND